MAHVAVFILNWNGAPDALDCVSTLFASSYRDYSYMVVDNGSTDDSLRVLRDALGPEHVKSVGHNKGYAGGMNHAIEDWMQTEARFGLLLTQDVRLERNTLAVLVDVLTRESGLGIVGPVLVNRRNGSIYSAGGYIRRDRGQIMHRMGDPNEAPSATSVSPCTVDRVQWLDGCCLLLRREVIDSIGAFDARFFMYVEEVDLCHRASKAGWDIGLARAGQASQIPGATSSAPTREYYLVRNRILFCKKHFGTRTVARAVASSAWLYVFWNLRWRRYARGGPLLIAGFAGIIHGIAGKGGQMPRWLTQIVSSQSP